MSKPTPEQESEYLEAYFEAWSLTEEYQGMSKPKIRTHLDEILSEYRILLAGLWGQVECARKFGNDDTRLENIINGNNTRH